MKLEVGKCYVSCCGEVAGPMKSNRCNIYPFKGVVNGCTETFTEAGLYYAGSIGGGRHDLVAEVGGSSDIDKMLAKITKMEEMMLELRGLVGDLQGDVS